MSEENNNLGEDAKEAAKKASESTSEKASDFKEDAKEVFEDVKEETKETASDFKEGAKEAFDDFSNIGGDNKKMLAGILAILLGTFGVHKFILGYQKEGLIMLGIGVLGFATTCLVIGVFILWIPGIIGLIEGIIYLTKSDEEFYNTYQKNKKPWF